jgi:hypothetical protein
MFKTPRLLIEIKVNGKWNPYGIYCQYASVRQLLDRLPKLKATRQYGMDNVRVKYLATNEQIAQAKDAIYKQNNEH